MYDERKIPYFETARMYDANLNLIFFTVKKTQCNLSVLFKKPKW